MIFKVMSKVKKNQYATLLSGAIPMERSSCVHGIETKRMVSGGHLSLLREIDRINNPMCPDRKNKQRQNRTGISNQTQNLFSLNT